MPGFRHQAPGARLQAPGSRLQARGFTCGGNLARGAKDTQLPARASADRLENALREAGHADFTIHVYPDSGHTLESASTGWIRPDLFELVSDWIHSRTSPNR